MRRKTLTDIARIAKVSHVTVSLALRAHPRIPATPRARIEYGGCSHTKRGSERSRATHCALTICAAANVRLRE